MEISHYKKAINKLQNFENEYNPFQWKIKKIPIWSFARYRIATRVRLSESREKKKNSEKSEFIKRFWQKIRKALTCLAPASLFIKNIKSSKKLYVGSTNCRRGEKHYKLYNIFFDPLIDYFQDDSYLVLEQNNGFFTKKQLNQVYSKNFKILDFAVNIFTARSQLDLISRYYYTYKINLLLKNIDCSKLGITKKQLVSILVGSSIPVIKSGEFFISLLKKIKPEIIVTTCGYCYWMLILTYYANMLRIPVVELQHGVINSEHAGYIFPKNIGELSANPYPKAVLTFSGHYADILKQHSNLPTQFLNAGHLYMRSMRYAKVNEKELRQSLNIPPDKKIILITTQPVTQLLLHDLIYNFSISLPEQFHIILKIHPNEKKNYKTAYKALLNLKNITFIINDRPTLYELFRMCTVHASVFSTSLEEASAFGLYNFVIKKPGWENMQTLINLKGAYLVTDHLDFIDKIQHLESYPQNAEGYFFDLNQYDINGIFSKILNSKKTF